MKIKARYLIALVFIVVSQIFTVLSPTITYADKLDGPYIDKTFVDALQQWDYRDAIVSCFAQGAQESVLDVDTMNAAKWFIMNKGERMSYYTDPSDGLWGCSDEINQKLKDILAKFGWTTPVAAACALGYKQVNVDKEYSEWARTNLQNMYSDNPSNGLGTNASYPECGKDMGGDSKVVYFIAPFPNNANIAKISSTVDTARKSTDNITTKDEWQYAAGWEALRLGCKLTTSSGDGLYEVEDFTSNRLIDGSGSASPDNKAAVIVVNQDGTTSNVLFPIKNPATSIDIGPKPGDENKGWGINFGSCSDLAKFINDKSVVYKIKIADMKAKGELGGAYTGTDSGTGDTTDEKPTCTVEGIGWIVCPVMNFMAGVNDTLFGALSDMLNVPPSIFTANSNTDKYADLYAAWNAFRGYANILFIVAFLVIIYSQITSVGITNYGIKKLLPKLIIAAILVNASYYLCQIAVDLSNILGYGLKSLFVAIGGGIDTSNSATGNWASNIGGALAFVGAAAGVVALVLAISVPVVLSGLLALLMVVVILIVRRAIVILLIVVSPLAFVAWLLPNTEKWFKKWWDLFLSMLVLFPVISVLFGAGALAGKILGSADFGNDGGVAKLAALGASVLPLFATIPLLQGALKATGALGSKLSGMSAAANKRFTSGAQKTGKERYDNSSYAKGRALRKQGKEEYRNRRFAEGVTGEDTTRLGRLRRKAALGVTGGRLAALTKRGDFAQNRITTAAQAKVSSMEAEEQKEQQTQIANEAQKFRTMSSKDIVAQATSADVSDVQRAAAIQHIMKTGSHTEKRAVLAAAHTTTAGGHAQSAAAEGYYSSGSNEFWGNGLGDKIKAGQKLDLDSEMKANFGNMSGATLLKSATSTAEIKRVAGTATDAELAKLSTAVTQVGTNTQLQAALTGNVGTDFSAIKSTVDAAAARSGGGTP